MFAVLYLAAILIGVLMIVQAVLDGIRRGDYSHLFFVSAVLVGAGYLFLSFYLMNGEK